METPAQRIQRWIDALDDLTGQESLLLQSGEPRRALPVQQRIGPLIEALVAHAADVDSAARRRIAAVVERRRTSEAWLNDALGRGRAELRQLESDRRRLIRMRPAYAGPDTGGSYLLAVG